MKFETDDQNKSKEQLIAELQTLKKRVGSLEATASEHIETVQALIKSEEKFSLAFNTSPDSIAISRISDSVILEVNNGFCILSGYSREEVLGNTANGIGLWVDVAQREKILATLEQKGEVKEFEVRMNHKKGSFYWGLISARRFEWENEECILWVVRDITTAKQAEADRQRLEKQLFQAQKMEALGTLAGGIAHDFNNILGAIYGYTELAIDDITDKPHITQHLQQVIKSADRAKDLVQQILTFSRQTEQSKKPIDVVPIIKETLKLLNSSLPSTIDIRQDVPHAPFMVMAEPTRIHQVMMNLCVNAAYAMKENGGTLTIELAHTHLDAAPLLAEGKDLEPGEYVVLTVGDTGTGIPADILGHIFDPYMTTKGPGEGTGLGLSVVHGIVKNYHGDITVESEIGKGTTFFIYLPALTGANEQVCLDEGILNGGNERILFVDDEAALVDIGGQMLEKLGYTVTTKTSSLEALKLFKSDPHAFDLVITDHTMPNLTGEKLAVAMLHIRPDIPIILCTGFSYGVTEAQLKTKGIKRLAMKPLIKADIGKVIREVLDAVNDD